jgi:ubiquinone/menaquinone biosynthesis C-methylase UbiE
MDFHNRDNRWSHSTREADPKWVAKIREICEPTGKSVLDIGCGGGIYTHALADMGAAHVTGVDFSKPLLESAQEKMKTYTNVDFHLGEARATHLPSNQYDLILERALIHHIKTLAPCFEEAFRLLKSGGVYLIQDRTPEDCLLEGSPNHIRGYFFQKFPWLAEKEVSRRHSSETVMSTLEKVGFKGAKAHEFWEVRKTYLTVQELKEDLLNRTGRSILHELSDDQLNDLVEEIGHHIESKGPIYEKDRWTIWKAVK